MTDENTGERSTQGNREDSDGKGTDPSDEHDSRSEVPTGRDESDSSSSSPPKKSIDLNTNTDLERTDIPSQSADSPDETRGSKNSEQSGANSSPTPDTSDHANDTGADMDDDTGADMSGVDGFSGDIELDDLDLDAEADDEADEASRGLFDDLLEGEPIFENKEVLRPSYTPHKLPHARSR